MNRSLNELAGRALAELAAVFNALPSDAADPLIEAISSARRIAVYGAGREGLALKGFAMRLFHLGLDIHVIADMTTPALGTGDLLIVTSGQGRLPTAEPFMEIAKSAGAQTAIITAQPNGRAAKQADLCIVIPAQTMADDQGDRRSVLPMGSLFEFAETLFFELVVLKLQDVLGETADTMRARHTNLQ